MSSAFLMPKKMVQLVANETKKKVQHNNAGVAAYLMAEAVSEIFNVSNEAALYRLKSLGLVGSDVQHQSAVYDFLDLLA
jgi:Zn-dependent peptidase ImmA (M78 family)